MEYDECQSALKVMRGRNKNKTLSRNSIIYVNKEGKNGGLSIEFFLFVKWEKSENNQTWLENEIRA